MYGCGMCFMVPVAEKVRVETSSEVHIVMLPRTMRGRFFRGRGL